MQNAEKCVSTYKVSHFYRVPVSNYLFYNEREMESISSVKMKIFINEYIGHDQFDYDTLVYFLPKQNAREL